MNLLPGVSLYEPLKTTLRTIAGQSGLIAEDRRQLLQQLAEYIQSCRAARQPANLIFICTHNSRRSHIAQLWAQAAAYVYEIENVLCFSGGTEATAFNPRAVRAMREAGFTIDVEKEGSNPLYRVSFAEEAPPVHAFSKVYDDDANPSEMFAAVMTCSHADENCPFIPGAARRIALTYDDPKDFDDTPQEEEKYRERVYQIGREIMYAFSLVTH